ncbi:MAG: hypothetical protein R6X15_05655 [Pseudomonadota bacterium]
MSHRNCLSFQPTGYTSALFAKVHWKVREDNDEYSSGQDDLADLTDIINDRLTKAEALAWVLHGSTNYPDHADSVTAMVIAELIHEALDAQQQQWDKIRRLLAEDIDN